jgi:hypothetical protein
MSHRFIAAEFKGLAREFRRRVEAADSVYGVALNKIVRPLEARLARKPKLRDGTMIDVARALQAINHPFRFRLSIDTPKRGHLHIVDWMISTSTDREEGWDDFEKTTCILKVDITTLGGVRVKTKPIATISGHALARWFQRSGSRDQAKLLADLTHLVHGREPRRPCGMPRLRLCPLALEGARKE